MLVWAVEKIQQIDMAILDFLAQNLHGGWTDGLMKFVTALGNIGFIWIVLSLVFLCFRRTRECGIFLLLALGVTALLGEGILKYVVQRPRPFVQDPGIVLMIPPPTGVYSFPSGHTASSFTAAVTLWKWDRRWGIAGFVLAALIAFSRLYLQVHYPTDVLAGAVLGTVVALAVWKWGRKSKIYQKYHAKLC